MVIWWNGGNKMVFAINKDRRRVHINDAQIGEEYFCPFCDSAMIPKMGDVKIHHFAHRCGNPCRDNWHYDMSEWHYEWQNKFPLECQEIVKKYGRQSHRADVLIEEKKTVFEFQHSALSATEFEKRNEFYTLLGYCVIWIFDVEEQYSNDQIENYRDDLWKWKNPKKTFEFFNCKNKNVIVYLQLEEDYLIKVTWCTPDGGFSRFATDGCEYSAEDVVDAFDTKKKELKLSDLYDTLLELYSKDHTTYYFGCPISTTHMAANWEVDIPKEKYDEIMPCTKCMFNVRKFPSDGGAYICKKRFQDLNLDADTQVQIESKNNDGFVSKISYIVDGNRVNLEIPTFTQSLSKSVYELWKEDVYTIATFRNVRTGKFIRINKNPKEQFHKYGKVYGYISSNKYSFSGESMVLYGLDRPDWICIWWR